MNTTIRLPEGDVWDRAKLEKNWMCFRVEHPGANGKANKVPCNARGGYDAATTNAAFMTFDQAVDARQGLTSRIFEINENLVARGTPDKQAATFCVGYLARPGSAFVTLDLDNVIGPDGALADWVPPLGETYTEVSTSGIGLHMLTSRHSGDDRVREKNNAGIYAGVQRGIALTFTHVEGSPTHINEAPIARGVVIDRIGKVRKDKDAPAEGNATGCEINTGVVCDRRDVPEILDSLPNPANGRDEWVRMAHACKAAAFEADTETALRIEQAFIAWSQRGEAHGASGRGNSPQRLWDSIKTIDTITPGTFYHIAAGLGWAKIADRPATREDTTARDTDPPPAGDPVDLWGSFDPPDLPKGVLPPIIEQFARANGAQMGADPSGLAMAALTTCAAAIPDQIQIKVKRHDDWTESARLWAALMGPPSAKKSPIISAATGPLCRLDMQMMRAWQQRMNDYDALSTDEKKAIPRPMQTRLRIEDATVEAAQQVLEGSPWGVLLLQDELSGFFGAMDKYNGGKGAQADRAFWLRSFNGGQFALNRVGRGATIIENLSVSMLGGIQPEPLRKIAGDSVDDGLLQRLFPIMLRTATLGRDEPMPPVNAAYQVLIQELRELTLPGWMEQGLLQFDDGAQAIRRDLEARHLDLQSLETINRKLASHIGKYDGLFARLCVVWHCIEHIESMAACENPDPDAVGLRSTVTEATARRVATFLHRFLLAHAIAFYSGVLGLSDDHDRLTAIAGYILTQKLDRITNRDVQRGDRTMRGLKEHEIRPLLEQLAALGWLDRIDPPRPSSPPHWQVNPAVHQKFADRATREKERRCKARETIRDLSKGAV
ncbi:DUF3987 domain-containing protein [Roseovarius sp. ZX-A-9]|uniref:DUF3987 domain-containing protein n=1 Tax=Roseovarius sp. ZX-A-9 TaxID=3014783 RepID=UPI00232C8775|nr:DUF3987 domain-containing protein [Roseovarius sp. ZX-A-9]